MHSFPPYINTIINIRVTVSFISISILLFQGLGKSNQILSKYLQKIRIKILTYNEMLKMNYFI